MEGVTTIDYDLTTIRGFNGAERRGAARKSNVKESPENIGFRACFRGLRNGGSRGIRTHDPVIKSHLLYQLSYTPMT